MLGWSTATGRMIRFGARGLVGFGTATLATDLETGRRSPRMHDRFNPAAARNARFLASDDFFVFEPQMNAAVRLMQHVGIEIGGGYRVSGATDALDDRLNGVTGSLALQLTW
jgi:hypothetical protein